MPIYSQNRTGTFAASTVKANESYIGTTDIARIMYENEINDQALFEAAIGHDFAEAKALREGTLLESELGAMNEASAKEFFKGLVEKIKKFWEKIKGVFRNAIAKISAFVVRDGKKFVDLHRKRLTTGDFSKVEIKDFQNFDSSVVTKTTQVIKSKNGMKLSDALKVTDADSMNSKLDGMYAAVIPGASASTFASKFKEAAFEKKDVKMTAQVVKSFMDTLYSGKDQIKAVKELEKSTNKALGDLIKEINDANTKIEKASGHGGYYQNASKYVSGCQTFVAASSRACIGALKKNFSAIRYALAKCVAYNEAMEISADRSFCEAYAISEAEVAAEEILDDLESPVEVEDVEIDDIEDVSED